MSFKTTTQFSVPVVNKLGELGRITAILGKAKINLNGIKTSVEGGTAFIRFCAQPRAKVVKTLKRAGFAVLQVPAFIVNVSNRPGQLSKICKKLAQQKVNIVDVFGSANGEQAASLTFVVDNPAKAKKVFRTSSFS